ncbi:endonuclease/exonuclease/phosphatase family protein [Leifsonia sp. YIM 134122]|uniref:Endonuclease/exonuclease/phosphatase family protein n=1 Tax=Leifsonia stereocauli TaxID=3134136 RepID=A0ABU9VZT5_9MICO
MKRTVTPDAIGSPAVGAVASPEVHLMTLNVRRRVAASVSPADLWSRRAPLLARLLAAERPTVLGIQEALPDQAVVVADALGDRYTCVGTGRDADRRGERCEIHIDGDRMRFLDMRVHWLSDTPDTPGSRSFGNLLPRVAVQAEVEELEFGGRFHVIVTHLDHLSEKSRRRSARFLRGIARSLDGPVVVMGDFNGGRRSGVFAELTGDDVLVDTWGAAARRLSPEWGTYSRYKAPVVGGDRLDRILVSPSVQVDAAAINPVRFDGAAASDHEPVHAVVRWPHPEPEPSPRPQPEPDSREDGDSLR